MNVAQTDPKASYVAHKNEIDGAIQRVLESGWFILGQETQAFEREFATYLGLGSVVGVGNGTDALEISLRACGIGHGDVVATVSHTAVATVAAIELTGARPLFVDIDPASFTMDPNGLRDAVRSFRGKNSAEGGARLKAIVPVHLYGHPANMPAIVDVAEEFDLFVVEDCAQAAGAKLNGKIAGAWGEAACFSFYPTKNLGALGDGGAVVTNDAGLGERVRMLREYGWKDRYISAICGMNTRLDELQSAILRVKLKYLDSENARRRELARIYHTWLKDSSVVCPAVKNGVDHAWHQYVIRTPRRDELQTHLKKNGIGSLVHYPRPVHLQPAYEERFENLSLKETERASSEVLSLPMHPQLTDDEASVVAESILAWVRS